MEKGVAFPTCVSIGSIVGHFSPMSDDSSVISAGDLVKIDLGCHIDGFIATLAQTIVVQSSADEPVKGKAADVISAAKTAFEAALRLIRPGKTVNEVAPVLQKIAEAYGCTVVEGVMSHQMKQFVIDGNKCVLNKPSPPETKVDDEEFEENEVYAIDIVISTGEGKPKVLDEKATTVYKRALDQEYQLKVKSSRALFSEISKRFPSMPFTLRAIAEGSGSEGDKGELLAKGQIRLGLVECLNHGLLHPYPVLHEKAGELVAQIKGTVLLMPNGSDVVTKAPAQTLETEKKVEDADVLAILATSVKASKKKKKAKGDKADEAAPPS